MTPIAKYILRNLASSPFITALVLTSMVVVGSTVGGVVGVLSGLRRAFSTTGHDNRVIVSDAGSHTESDSILAQQSLGPITVRPEIVRSSPEVVVDALVLLPMGGVHPVTLRGLEPQGFEMHEMQLVAGRMPEKGAAEMIVGETLHSHLPWLGIGSTLDVVNEKLTCVGIFRSAGYLGGEVWTTRATVMSDPRRTALSVVYLDTKTKEDATALSEKLRTDRALNVQAFSEQAFYAKILGDHDHLIKAMMVIFVLVVFGAILVASSLLSLLQQRRVGELFTLRAIGFRSRAIAAIVLWETEILALGGGAVGLGVSVVALRNYSVLSASPGGSAITFRPHLTLELAIASLGAMCLVGILGALVPIVRALRAQVASGLREE